MQSRWRTKEYAKGKGKGESIFRNRYWILFDYVKLRRYWAPL